MQASTVIQSAMPASWDLTNDLDKVTVTLQPTEPSKKSKISPVTTSKRTNRGSAAPTRPGRPKHISLPISFQSNPFEAPSPSMPILSSAWGIEPVMTPMDSPEGTYTSFWGPGEGSVVSSTSSTESRERTMTNRKGSKLERPMVGRPTDSRERCMSVSLVVGPDGNAQVQREEVEVEFLQRQKEIHAPSASLMSRMVSSAGSEISVSRTLNNMSLVNSTRGEVLVRSTSLQPDMSHSMPLTPGAGPTHQFVSPMLVRKDSEQLFRNNPLMHTPESCRYDDSESDQSEPEEEIGAADAQYAVKKLFDRKHGTVADGFVGSTMPASPSNLARVHSYNHMACGACQIVFRSKQALSAHTARCFIKQTPFVSTDFFNSVDIFQMSEDAIFQMSSFTESSGNMIGGTSSSSSSSALLGPSLLEGWDLPESCSINQQSQKVMSAGAVTQPSTPIRTKTSISVLSSTKRKR